MNKCTWLLLFLLTMVPKHLWAASTMPGESPDFRQEIISIYEHEDSAWRKKDLAGILKPYAETAVVMPEFHVTLFGKKAIERYYRQYLGSTETARIERTVTEVEEINSYVLEAGTFSTNIAQPGKPAYLYQGKYMHIWKKVDGNLFLEREIWGSSRDLDRSHIPLSAYVSPDTLATPVPAASKTASKVDRINRKFEQLIISSNGVAMADFYTKDAIYMPYYMPMLKGVDAIRAYYKQHEDPRTGINEVRIKASRVLDLDSYVLEDGYYTVHWRAGSSQGVVTGKNITVWKRDETGRLSIYRQMVCHD